MFSIKNDFINKKADIGAALIIDEEAYDMKLFIQDVQNIEIFDNSLKFQCQYESTETFLDVNLNKNFMIIVQKCDNVQMIVYKVKYFEETELYEGYWDYCYTEDECENFKNIDLDSIGKIDKKCIFSINNELLIKLRDTILGNDF
jgi:hypothetical protein